MKRAFITGIGGFAGSHLAEFLLDSGWEVAGVERPGASLESLAGIAGRLKLDECDILRRADIEAALDGLNPDVVFHLAAVSSPPFAEKNPSAALDVNVKGTANVLEACRSCCPSARFLCISSAEVYGRSTQDEVPTTESAPPRPVNVYAVSKECAERIALFYEREHDLPVVVIRAFSHIGPRQRPDFVTASFAQQIAEIEKGEREPVLFVGNLEAQRDFTDVRDMVRGYAMAAEKCVRGEIYNICSGRAYSIRELLDILLGKATCRITVSKDPKRMRRVDMPVILGDCGKFAGKTGWKPQHAIDSTLGSILDYWSEKTRVGAVDGTSE